jgi:hypothetical protein
MNGIAVKSFSTTERGNIKRGSMVKDTPKAWIEAGLVKAVEEEKEAKKPLAPKKETATKKPKSEKAVKE